MIELRNVSLLRKDRHILERIDWNVRNGEHWVLYGRNGAGKTLLLEIISGYLFPTEGEVVRFGKLHGDYDIREIRKRIGYVSTFIKHMFSRRERVIDVVTSGLFASVVSHPWAFHGSRSPRTGRLHVACCRRWGWNKGRQTRSVFSQTESRGRY